MAALVHLYGFRPCQENQMDIAVNPLIGADLVPTNRFTDLVLGKIRGSITIFATVLYYDALCDSKNQRLNRANSSEMIVYNHRSG